MAGRSYASRQKAVLAAQEHMRVTFGADIQFELSAEPPNSFLVLDGTGHHLESFGVFQVERGTWSWAEATPRD
jgi:hypothetical protein